MTVESLKEYLSIVVDMEQNIFLQKELCKDIEEEIWRLKTPKEIIDPPEPETEKPTEPPTLVMPEWKLYKPMISTGAIIGGCIGTFFIGGMTGMVLGSATHWYNSVLLALILPVVWVIYCIWSNKTCSEENDRKNEERRQKARGEHQEKRKKYEQEYQQYQQELDKYHRLLAANKHLRQQDEAERALKTAFLQRQKEEIEKAISVSQERLEVIYQRDIIFPKYRNLVMACSIQEYVCAGLCTTLEGPDGAYNLLETYMRLDRISTQLDKVITNLEQIRENQFMLYSAVQEANRRLGQIAGSIRQMTADLVNFYSSSLYSAAQLNAQFTEMNLQNAQLTARIAELQKSSALTAYHAERTQKELAYMNRINYLSGKNDDVFWNHPPV